jgi:hypothetical protein
MKTQTSAVMGTPTYMSPEQCRGAGKVDQRADVYALGCVLFHLLVGRPPFDAEGIGDIIAMHLREPPPAPSSRAVGIPPEVDQLVLRCLAKDPAPRFGSAGDLALAIGGLVGSSPNLAAAPRTSGPYYAATSPTTLSAAAGAVSASSGKRSRALLFGGIGVVAAIGGVIAVVATRGGSEESAAPAASTSSAPAAAPATAPAPTPPAPPPAPPPDPRAVIGARMKDVLQKFVAWSRDHGDAPCPDLAALGVTAADLKLTCTDQPGDQIVGVVSADGVASWELGNDVTGIVRGARWAPHPPPSVANAHAKKPAPAPTKPAPPAKTKPTKSVELDENGLPVAR